MSKYGVEGVSGEGIFIGKKRGRRGKGSGYLGGKEEDGSRGKRIFLMKDKQEEGREGDIWRGKKEEGAGRGRGTCQ